MLTRHFKLWSITIVLAMALLSSVPSVSGQQEPIYILDEQPTAATSTPLTPVLEVEDFVPITHVHSKEEVPNEDYVVGRILDIFPDAPIMVAVARCESELDPSADRANLGVDVGLFQINQVHLDTLALHGLDRWDLEDNITYARMLYDESGLGPWYMSRHCWSQYL